MELSTLTALISVWLAAIASPGPDVVQILRLGSRSRADGVACALGIMIGNTGWILGSLLGISALVNAYPIVLTVLKLVGGGYLLWIGTSAIRAGVRAWGEPVVVPSGGVGGAVGDWGASIRVGVLTNLSNPKAILFFGAVFAQFVEPGMGAWVSAMIAAVLIITGLAWFIGVALVVQRAAGMLQRRAYVIELASGAVFVILGLVMVYGGMGELAS